MLRAHGVRGVVRVRATADLGGLDAVWLDDERFAVRHASRDKDEWLVTLDGVATREAAEALRGQQRPAAARGRPRRRRRAVGRGPGRL